MTQVAIVLSATFAAAACLFLAYLVRGYPF